MNYFKDYLRVSIKENVIAKCKLCDRFDLDEYHSDEYDIYDKYGELYDKLLSFGEWVKFRDRYKLYFRYVIRDDTLNDSDYIDVCLLNLNYSSTVSDIDDNVDISSTIKYFSVGYTPWRILCNLEVCFDDLILGKLNTKEICMDDLLSSALYEFSFYGFSETSYLKLRHTLKRININTSNFF